MTSEELDQWADDFAAFHARFAHLFVRSAPREPVVKYLRALMAPIARKNGWQMAEVMGDRTQMPRNACCTRPTGMWTRRAMCPCSLCARRSVTPMASAWSTKAGSSRRAPNRWG